MKRYLIRYLMAWLPAYLAALLLNSQETYAQIIQFFFAFFMVFMWAVNTSIAAYRFPRGILSIILIYCGCTLLSINLIQTTHRSSLVYKLADHLGGALSFRPLNIFIVNLRQFDFDQETWVVGALVVLCLIGYLIGVFFRYLKPNPYRPKVMDRG